MTEKSKKATPEKKAMRKKPLPAKPRRKPSKPKLLTSEQQLAQDMAVLDEDFEFALLEANKLAFPIIDPTIKLTQFQQKLQRIARNKRIYDLAVTGATVRQISARLTENGWPGASRSNVSKVLIKALDISARDADMSLEQLRRLELDKLEQIELMHLGPLLAEKEADPAEKRSRIIERILRLRYSLLNLTGSKVKVEIPTDGTPTGEIKTEIRVILPTPVVEE